MGKWRKSWLANVIFAVIGIALIVGGTIWLVSINNFMKTAVKTEATITSIKEYVDRDDETQYTTIAEFTVGGVSYSDSVSHHSWQKVGDTVTVYYNPDDPQDFKERTDSIVAIVFIGSGILFSFVGFFPVIYKLIPESKNRRV